MVGITLSAFIFAFAILATVPSVRAQMQKPDEMPLVVRDAILFTVLLYEAQQNVVVLL
jgi:amino acid permease